jgi:hypothetical protein
MKHASMFLLLSLFLTSAALADGGLALPKDWRSFAHAKSMVIPDPKHPLGGFHHVYVSPKGFAAYQAGGTHPAGSELVVPFYEIVDKEGTVNQGALKMIAVMKKDPSATATGGWRYGAFDPSGKALAIDVVTGCYNCHTAQKSRDFVFSSWQ